MTCTLNDLLNNGHCKANHGGYPVKTQLIRTVCYVKAETSTEVHKSS